MRLNKRAVLPPLPIANTQFAEPIAEMLKQHHRSHATSPLRAPGETESIFNQFLHEESLTIVLDTNVLRNDILYACRTGRRTTLITAANTGALRVYVPEHVVLEIDKHYDEWCVEQKCTAHAFRERFSGEYLPRLLVVPKNAIPFDVLTPEEFTRIDALMHRDPDDVPAAVLSLVLGAPFLTMDEAAYEAVYGEYRPYQELQSWRETLTAGSDTAELAKWQFIVTATPIAAACAAWRGIQSLTKLAPWLVALLGVGALYATFRNSTRSYHAVANAALKFVEIVYEIQRPYQIAVEPFRAAAPRIAPWHEMALTVDKRALLHRACLRTLAHSPVFEKSAQELAAELPNLGVRQSTTYVRATLQTHASFVQYRRGRYRVGNTFAYNG